MKPLTYHKDDPVVALATPWGESAVAVIRTSGTGSLKLLSGCFSRPQALLGAESHRLVHGTLFDPETRQEVDEVICAVFQADRGYTGEEAVEIYCHGSLPGIQLILDLLRTCGFRDAEPGEFTLRAFLKGRLDLTQAEAVREIVSSRSRAAHSMALHRLGGGISNRINGVKHILKQVLGTLEIQMDYPEDEVALDTLIDRDGILEAGTKLRSLSATYSTGRLYQEGARLAIAGRTNAGKSSLFNLFVREDRSIVSDIHGTTRDFVHEQITIRGLPVTLYDTAGLRIGSTDDSVEMEGIRRSGKVTGEADLVLYLVDSSEGLSPGETDKDIPEKTLFIWSKADLPGRDMPEGYISLSTVTGEGFHDLEEAIHERLLGIGSGSADAVIDSARQRDLLLQAAVSLDNLLEGLDAGMPADALGVDLRDALDALGELTGEITTEEVLNDMFSRFCVGK